MIFLRKAGFLFDFGFTNNVKKLFKKKLPIVKHLITSELSGALAKYLSSGIIAANVLVCPIDRQCCLATADDS